MTNELYRKLTAAVEIDNEIKEINLQIDKLRSMFLPEAIRYDKDKIQTSPSNDLLSDTIDKIMELENSKSKLATDYIKAMESVCWLINRLTDGQARLVLKHRYIDNISWTEVSTKMQYSKEWCFKKHKEAVDKLDLMLKLSL